MNLRLHLAYVLLCLPSLPVALHAGSRSSADYAITADTIDSAGQRTASADGIYRNDGSAGGLGGTSAVTGDIARQGFLDQLYELAGYGLLATDFYPAEGGTTQIQPVRTADDGSNFALPATGFTFGIVSGPLAGISPTGLVTAGNVFADTPAEVRATSAEFDGELRLPLFVMDSIPDNFGLYAGDGLADGWQARHFGTDNPLAAPALDPDGDGQSNLFEFTAGLLPADGASRFRLDILPGLAGGEHRITFGPRLPDRTYTVEAAANPGDGSFLPLQGSRSDDDGTTRTVTDPAVADPARFYRIRITLP